MLAIAIMFGALVAWNPKKAINTQTAIYRIFNWKLVPISMQKEMRNTRIMGLIVIIAGALAAVYIALSK